MDDGSDSLVGTTVGKYLVRRCIGSGGMGTVYEAEHKFIGALVAIKVISHSAHRDPQQLERFYREARATSAIRHDGIVNIFDIEVLADGRPCLIMELLEGSSLEQLIADRRKIQTGVLVHWMVGFVGALAAAHECGVVHRDLKPANLFVTRTGRTELLDFGIARLLTPRDPGDHSFSTGGLVLGTTPYMAPEQACGDPCDHRSDIYSIGVVMYQALTGLRPYRGKSISTLLLEQRDGPVPPRELAFMPTELEAVILRAMASLARDRYQTTKELLDDLRRIAKICGVSRNRRASAPPGRLPMPFLRFDTKPSDPPTPAEPATAQLRRPAS